MVSRTSSYFFLIWKYFFAIFYKNKIGFMKALGELGHGQKISKKLII